MKPQQVTKQLGAGGQEGRAGKALVGKLLDASSVI